MDGQAPESVENLKPHRCKKSQPPGPRASTDTDRFGETGSPQENFSSAS